MLNVSQQEWDRIFKKPKVTRPTPTVQYVIDFLNEDTECCGCEDCGFSCGCMCS